MLHSNKLFFTAFMMSVFGLTACNSESETITKKDQVRPVKIVSTGNSAQQQVTKFPAVVNDHRLVELSFESGGRIVEFLVQNAQSLKEGDVIGRLDQRDLNNNLEKATAQYNSANAEYRRAAKLSKSNAIAKSTLQQKKTERDVSLVQLNIAKQAVKDAVLKAPFDGVVAQTLVENGQSVSGGQAVLVFIGGDTLEASIDVPASYLAELYKSDSEERRTESYISLDVASESTTIARYKEAVLIADANTQTYKVTFEFDSPEGVLVLPGMNATIEMRALIERPMSHIAVPLSAISIDGKSTYVWIVDQQKMTVSKREVHVAEEVGDTQIVTQGLELDEWVVSAGVSYLYEGIEVRKWQ